MRGLLLGNSNDSCEWFEGAKDRHEIVLDRPGAIYDEDGEVIARSIWPRADLADTVDGWIARYDPDVIYLTMLAYWFQYRSVPLRAKRLLGRFGEGAGNAGFRIAESPRWAYNPVFRTARSGLQATIGGDPHFTTGQVVERLSEVIRRAARHEGVVLAIQGADGRTAYSRSKRGRRKDEERRLEVQRAMRDFCAAQHIWYENSETPAWATDPELARNRVGDGLHANARWHAHSAELIVGTIRNALEDAGHAEGRRGDAVADRAR